MKRKSRFLSILAFFLSLSMALQGSAMAQVSVSVAVPIRVKVNITTHPDYYNTRLPIQMGSPVVSDLDADWVLEMIGAGYNPNTQRSSVFVWHRNGTLKPGWPVEVEGRIENIPAVGDLDGDGDLEIAACVSKIPPEVGGWIYVWHHDGSLYEGYPVELDYGPGAPVFGDVEDGFEEELHVYPYNVGVVVYDKDLDGKKDLALITPDESEVIGTPVAGDVDGDGTPEVFQAVNRPDGNYIYGWHSDGSEIIGWPVNAAGVVNTPGAFLSLADINGDGVSEILTGSTNGWIAGWHLDGSVSFSQGPIENAVIYQPIAGDIDNDGDMEILASSNNRNIYCYDHDGNLVEGWPRTFSYGLSQGIVLADIDSDSLGDSVNPVNDMELLYGGSDGRIHIIELPGSYNPNNIQWGMYGFNPRNSGNYLRDWDTAGWSVVSDEPGPVLPSVNSVYDWNRGNRVIELRGAGVNSCYVFMRPDGRLLNSENTTLQWAMRYHLPINLYVSIDTMQGKRYLYYTATEGNEPFAPGDIFIHHGLGGDADNGRWQTFSRSLVSDLKDAEPGNEIVDINAIYVQGSGRIDDLLLIPGLPTVDLENLAFAADVSVSSGDATKGFINDGDPATKWVSDDINSWIEYTWPEPQDINKIVIDAVEGATGGTIYITDSIGMVHEIGFTMPLDGGPLEVIFGLINDVVSVRVVFNNDSGPVSVGEISVYNDPNVSDETCPPHEGYSVDDYIRLENGYFFDPLIGNYYIPHGIAYQTWNQALGQWQGPAELMNDLDGMAGAGANAIRADFVWRHIEVEDGVYDFTKHDMLLEEAQARGMKVFALIGYQWPPDWFPPEWYTMHPQNENHPDGPWLSDVISYEDPDVQAQFRDFLQAVVTRYSVGGVREDLSSTVAGWILGNEYGYMGLWSIEYDGYDPDCQTAFRQWLEDRYGGDIGALNAKWLEDNIRTPGYLPGHPYGGFDEVDMPISFGYQGENTGKYLARDKASWYDLTEWREASIARFVSLASQAVREVDEHHLITYASVGMQWGEEDWRYHTEDARKIAQACMDIGAPLSFWSINNYPWGLENNELMTGQWGIEKARHDTGLPVMITETGSTTTETIYPGIDEERQARLVRNAVWEAFESGAVGVCVFHWNDREHPGLTQRERGFGIVRQNREPKPAYTAVRDTFNRIDEIDMAQYLVGSSDPVPDIAFLWDDSVDTIINRYKAEMKELFGTLERLGYDPTFINDEELGEGLYLDYEAIVLPRNQKMFDSTFELLSDIRASGVKIHADSDIPGIMNEYGELRDRDSWLLTMDDLFGIDAANTDVDLDLEDAVYIGGYETGSFILSYMPKTIIYPGIGFNKIVNMWKYRDMVDITTGVAMAAFGEDGPPALVFNDNTAISLFSMGDSDISTWTWADRYDWMKTIYMDPAGFGIQPELMVSNKHVLVDYREGGDFILLSFKNYKSDTEETVEVTTDMISGKRVIDLLTDAVIEDPCDGTILRVLEPDGHDLVLAYNAGADDDDDEDEDGEDVDGEDTDTDTDSNTNGTGGGGGGAGDGGAGGGTGGNPGAGNGAGSSGTGSTGKNIQYIPVIQNIVKESILIKDTSSLPEKDDTKDNNTISGIGGPPVIIIFGEEKEKEKGKGKEKDTGGAGVGKGKAGTERVRPQIRTYTGGGESSYPEEKVVQPPIEELPPLEQFQRIIEENRGNEEGLLRAAPKIVSPKKLQEIRESTLIKEVKQAPANDVGKIVVNWIIMVKVWWQDLVKTIQLTLNRNISRRYA